MELSGEYTDEEILTVEDWLEYAEDANVCTIIKIAQMSSDLNINDEYIRVGVYYYSYKTSNNIMDLIDKDEVLEWIASALDDELPSIEELDAELRKN